MISKKDVTAPHRRRQLEQELAALAPAVKEFERVGELEAAANEADAANAAFRQSPEYLGRHGGERDPAGEKAIELSGIATKARSRFDDMRAKGKSAWSRTKVINALLGASGDVAKHEADLGDIAAEGAKLEQREQALAKLCDSLRADIADVVAKREHDSAAAADERIAARMEGREVKAPATIDGPALTQLRADLAAATRQRDQAQQRVAEIGARCREVAELLRKARRLAAQVAYEEWKLAGMSIEIEAMARDADLGFGPTELMVAERRRAIAQEDVLPWVPTIARPRREDDAEAGAEKAQAA